MSRKFDFVWSFHVFFDIAQNAVNRNYFWWETSLQVLEVSMATRIMRGGDQLLATTTHFVTLGWVRGGGGIQLVKEKFYSVHNYNERIQRIKTKFNFFFFFMKKKSFFRSFYFSRLRKLYLHFFFVFYLYFKVKYK